MAMLAEPRRKVKLSVDPRNVNWTNDEDKFGQKMLQKFGWEKGKGLGANLDGMTDYVKVKTRTDNRGVGCSKKHSENWVAHQDDFNALLANLNSNNDSPSNTPKQSDKISSLEHKSKTAKGRVHYHKFTRGKDLSAAKAGDLDSIFGKRKSKSTSNTPITSTVNSEVNSCANSDGEVESTKREDGTTKDHSHGLTTYTHSLTVQEYFAQKMAQLKKSREGGDLKASEPLSTGQSGVESCESDQRGGIGSDQRQIGENKDIVSTPRTRNNSQQSHSDSEEMERKKKKKKSKKRKYAETEICDVDMDQSEMVQKKKSKVDLLLINEVEEDDPGRKSKKKKKKDKRKKEEEKIMPVESKKKKSVETEICDVDMDQGEMVHKKKSKVDILLINEVEEDDPGRKSKKKKKKDKRKKDEEEIMPVECVKKNSDDDTVVKKKKNEGKETSAKETESKKSEKKRKISKSKEEIFVKQKATNEQESGEF